jgi:S-adenosylmethionine decarboxylase
MDYVKPTGTHLLIDIHQANQLDNLQYIESILDQCVAACNATLIHHHLHHFGENKGITGVYLLSESHMSIHTWPELDFAAVDIFLCGDHNPYFAIDVLKKFFPSSKFTITEHLRNSKQSDN